MLKRKPYKNQQKIRLYITNTINVLQYGNFRIFNNIFDGYAIKDSLGFFYLALWLSNENVLERIEYVF